MLVAHHRVVMVFALVQGYVMPLAEVVGMGLRLWFLAAPKSNIEFKVYQNSFV
jgi:hypothetical protein